MPEWSIGDWFAVVCLSLGGIAAVGVLGFLFIGWLVDLSGGWR